MVQNNALRTNLDAGTLYDDLKQPFGQQVFATVNNRFTVVAKNSLLATIQTTTEDVAQLVVVSIEGEVT